MKKNLYEWKTINLKGEDNMKMLGLKIRVKNVVAFQQTTETKFKILVYNLDK